MVRHSKIEGSESQSDPNEITGFEGRPVARGSVPRPDPKPGQGFESNQVQRPSGVYERGKEKVSARAIGPKVASEPEAIKKEPEPVAFESFREDNQEGGSD